MKLALLGDIALFGNMSLTKNPDAASIFSEVADYLSVFDYVVGNLETPFSALKKTSGAKSAYICSDVENIDILKKLHVNAVCLSNNHMFDFGKEGYETTKKILDENGMAYFGSEGKELKVKLDENKISFSGFCCYTTNPLKCVPYGEYGVNAYNLHTVENILKRNSDDGFLNIVAVHAGLEHVNYPSTDHIMTARLLAEECPYVYYGHHPHVIQGIEEYKGSLIAHSLGNFCFDDVYTSATDSKPLVELTENNRTGMILELTIENNKVVDWKEQLIYIPKVGSIKLIENDKILKIYNEKLAHREENKEEYEKERSQIINERLAERKAQRNLSWFIKRLQPRYVKLMFDMRRNNKLYNENVKQYL